MRRRVDGEDPKIRDVAPETPDELARICDKATAHDPGDRYATAAELRAAIEGYLETSTPSPSRTALWLSLAGTGALTAGAVVTGILALGAQSDVETKVGTRGVRAADIAAARSKMATLALVTDVLGGAAIVMGGVTIVLAATSGKSRVDEAKPAAALLLSPRGALLTGQF